MMHMNSITLGNTAQELCSHADIAARTGRRLSRTATHCNLWLKERAGLSAAGATPLKCVLCSGDVLTCPCASN
jgi:hypothetical protein